MDVKWTYGIIGILIRKENLSCVENSRRYYLNVFLNGGRGGRECNFYGVCFGVIVEGWGIGSSSFEIL
jgi:hypothetical protein